MSVEEYQRPNSVDLAVFQSEGDTPSPATEFFAQSSMELSEDLRGTGGNEEEGHCRLDATPPSAAASKLKFSIHRILGFDDLPPQTSGVSSLPPRIFIRCLGNGGAMDDGRCDSSVRLTAVDEEDVEEDDVVIEREDHQEFMSVLIDGSGCEDKTPPTLSSSYSACSPSSQRLSWLQCTRYKPPKLPSQFRLHFS